MMFIRIPVRIADGTHHVDANIFHITRIHPVPGYEKNCEVFFRDGQKIVASEGPASLVLRIEKAAKQG